MDNMSNLTPAIRDRDIFEYLTQVSATNVFTTTEHTKLREAQRVEFKLYFKYLTDSTESLPPDEVAASMSHYCIHDDLLYSSSPPGHLRKRNIYRNKLVVRQNLIKLVLHACHYHALSARHLAFKPTFDK